MTMCQSMHCGAVRKGKMVTVLASAGPTSFTVISHIAASKASSATFAGPNANDHVVMMLASPTYQDFRLRGELHCGLRRT
eukprot:999301-Amphidinium_carterae.1